MINNGVDGLISGLPTGDLVDAMVNASRGSLRVTEERKVVFEARLEAVRALNTRLLTARLDSSTLKQKSTYTARVANSSNPSALTAKANSNAIPGSYSLEVVKLAQSHQVATQGQASNTQEVGSGDVILQLGNGAQTTLSLSNVSLNAVAAAINDEGMGITASVINDGQANPYRLVLQSNTSGLESEITVSGTNDFATLLNQGLMDELSEAQDAEVKFGAGAGAITVKNSSNQLTSLIPGVTIDLVGAGMVTVNVGTDTSAAETAIKTFVESTNSAIEYFRANSAYDLEKNEAGVLFSENDLRRSIESLTRAFTDTIDGLPTSMNRLSAIGIDVNKSTGLFNIDTEVLKSQLAANPDGVANLFLNRGVSSDVGIEFAAMNAKTDVSNPFTIDITTPASQAKVGTLGDLAATTVIGSGNSGLGFIVNNKNYFVNLVENSYTRSEMADHLNQVINDAIKADGLKVEVDLSGNALNFRSKHYGSSQSISILSSATQGTLNLSTAQATGVDVTGTIDGQAATGIGQVMQGVVGEASEGLRLLITSTIAVSGATLNVYEGTAQRLGTRLEDMTDVETGIVTIKEDSLTQGILDMEKQISDVDARLELRRARLTAQFQQMEKLLQQFQSEESFLKGQISGFQNLAAATANR